MLVKIVQAGDDGRFRLELDPGEYTVVVDDNGRLRGPSVYDYTPGAVQFWSTVEVRAGVWTSISSPHVLPNRR